MSLRSTLALAALLATTAGLAWSPAAAKDKPEQQARPNFSPAFLKLAQAAQEALKGDVLAAEPSVAAAEAAAKTDDDKLVAGNMRIQVEQARLRAGGATADQQRLRVPLETLLANPKINQQQRGQFAFVLAQLASQRNEPAETLRYLTIAQQAGYADPNMAALMSQAKLQAGDTAGGLADLRAGITAQEANGGKAPEVQYRFVIDRLIKSPQKTDAIPYLRRWVAAYPTAANWRDALIIYGLQTGSATQLDKRQTVDLLRLLRQVRGLNQGLYQEYAQDVVDLGLPDEGRAVLNEGVAAGQVRSTPGVTALLRQANNQISLQGSLAPLEAKAQAAANGSLAYQTGDAYLGQKNYAKAAALYRVALQKGGINAAEVNTHLGIALAMSGDKEGARAAFNAVTGAPRSDIAQFWILWLDHPPTA